MDKPIPDAVVLAAKQVAYAAYNKTVSTVAAARAARAADGVQAGKVEQRARELLAAEYDADDMGYTAQGIREGGTSIEVRAALRAIVVALSQQPAADPLEEWANQPLNFTATVGKIEDGVVGEQPAAADDAWQVQLADALECFWNPAIEGSGDDRSNIIGGMVQGFAAVAYRLREHAARVAQHKEPTT